MFRKPFLCKIFSKMESQAHRKLNINQLGKPHGLPCVLESKNVMTRYITLDFCIYPLCKRHWGFFFCFFCVFWGLGVETQV